MGGITTHENGEQETGADHKGSMYTSIKSEFSSSLKNPNSGLCQ